MRRGRIIFSKIIRRFFACGICARKKAEALAEPEARRPDALIFKDRFIFDYALF